MSIRYFIDGNMVCAVYPHFQNPVLSRMGFGPSLEAAFKDLVKTKEEARKHDIKSWEEEWVQELPND